MEASRLLKIDKFPTFKNAFERLVSGKYSINDIHEYYIFYKDNQKIVKIEYIESSEDFLNSTLEEFTLSNEFYLKIKK